MSLGLVCHYLLHHSCPGCAITGTFILQYAHELYGAIDGGEIVGEMERALEVEDYGIYHRSEKDSEDEHGKVFHHLCHLLRFQLAVYLASWVSLDSLSVAAIDATVAAPGCIAIANEGEEAHGDIV